MLPRALDAPLRAQLGHVHGLWQEDRDHGRTGVYLPHALAAKYKRAAESWPWFWVFPAPTLSSDPRGSGSLHRHHLHEKRLQHDLRAAVGAARLAKPATVHTSVTRSPPTCSRPEPTSAPCSSCSATPTSARP
jgi:hypothetical protein